MNLSTNSIMNSLSVNNIETLKEYLGHKIFLNGLYLMSSKVTVSEFEQHLGGIGGIILIKVHLTSKSQSFIEILAFALSHYTDDNEANVLLDSLIRGTSVDKLTVLEHVLYKCFSVLNLDNPRILVLLISGNSNILKAEELILLEDIIKDKKYNYAILIVTQKIKASVGITETKIFKTTNMDTKPNILDWVHISYKHQDLTDNAIKEIRDGLDAAGIPYSIDKDLDIRANIKDFEREIGMSKVIITIITPEYLRSLQCMFELKEIVKNQDFQRRIIPIVELDPIPRNSDGLQKIKGYWQEEKKKRLKQFICIEGSTYISSDIKDIDDIIYTLDNIWRYITDYKTGSLNDLSSNKAEKLIEIVKKAMAENKIKIGDTEDVLNTEPTATSPAPLDRKEKRVINQGDRSIYIERIDGTLTINQQ